MNIIIPLCNLETNTPRLSGFAFGDQVSLVYADVIPELKGTPEWPDSMPWAVFVRIGAGSDFLTAPISSLHESLEACQPTLYQVQDNLEEGCWHSLF